MYVLSSAASHLVCNIRSDHSPRPAAKDFATCRSPMPREDCLLRTAMRIRPQAAGMLTNTGASRMMMTMNRLAALAGCISYKLSLCGSEHESLSLATDSTRTDCCDPGGPGSFVCNQHQMVSAFSRYWQASFLDKCTQPYNTQVGFGAREPSLKHLQCRLNHQTG